jgi:hypothetical protein
MNAKTLIATALLVSFAGAGSAFAQEGTQDFPAAQLLSSKSRAEVRSSARDAVVQGEASAAPQAVSTLSRTQVAAETREAMRLGLIDTNERGATVATPAQLEQIRAAGLRALDTSLAHAAK